MSNTASLLTRIKFLFFVLTPFCAAALVIAFFFGCERKAPVVKTEKPAVTLDNLQTAYNKEMSFNRMYTLFADRAKKEKNPQIAALYTALAKSELIHSNDHAALLKAQGIQVKEPSYDSVKVGTTIQTLKMALSSEDVEIGSMYPNLIRTADLEKFKDAQTQFENCRDADARQEELLKDADSRAGKIAKVQYYVCPTCGYILNSEKTDECPICKTPKAKFEKI